MISKKVKTNTEELYKLYKHEGKLWLKRDYRTEGSKPYTYKTEDGIVSDDYHKLHALVVNGGIIETEEGVMIPGRNISRFTIKSTEIGYVYETTTKLEYYLFGRIKIHEKSEEPKPDAFFYDNRHME